MIRFFFNLARFVSFLRFTQHGLERNWFSVEIKFWERSAHEHNAFDSYAHRVQHKLLVYFPTDLNSALPKTRWMAEEDFSVTDGNVCNKSPIDLIFLVSGEKFLDGSLRVYMCVRVCAAHVCLYMEGRIRESFRLIISFSIFSVSILRLTHYIYVVTFIPLCHANTYTTDIHTYLYLYYSFVESCAK